MHAFLEHVLSWDVAVLEASQSLRWEPVTFLFVLASAWWVKGLLFAAAAALCDVCLRRRLPFTAALAGVSFVLTALLVGVLKDAFDRARPPLADPSLEALVALPENQSFPSGHAATAFAAATVLAAFYPRLRWPAFGLAGLVAFSRVYLGVHFWLDVLAGAAIGLAIGLAAAWAGRRIVATPSAA